MTRTWWVDGGRPITDRLPRQTEKEIIIQFPLLTNCPEVHFTLLILQSCLLSFSFLELVSHDDFIIFFFSYSYSLAIDRPPCQGRSRRGSNDCQYCRVCWAIVISKSVSHLFHPFPAAHTHSPVYRQIITQLVFTYPPCRCGTMGGRGRHS